MIRPASADKQSVQELRRRGVAIALADLQGDKNDLAQALRGQDVLLATLPPQGTLDQIKLADAALQAGIKRFVPNAWATVAPAQGAMGIREVVC